MNMTPVKQKGPLVDDNAFVCDIEADGLLDSVSTIWVIVTKSIETGDVTVYRQPDFDRFVSWFNSNKPVLIGHNFLSYDVPVLERILSMSIPLGQIVDTLILSRLYDPGKRGGHSLDAWGAELRFPKQEFNDFSVFSERMVEYCVNDVELNYRVYKKLKTCLRDFSAFSVRLEHTTQYILNEQTRNGFPVDMKSLRKYESDLTSKKEMLIERIRMAFPPVSTLKNEYTPKTKSDGTLSRVGIPRDEFDYYSSVVSPGCTFSTYLYKPFDINSPKQVVERMNAAGWRPVVKTKGHLKCESDLKREKDTEKRKQLESRLDDFKTYGWKVCEENLQTLPSSAPQAAHDITDYLTICARLNKIEEVLSGYKETTGCTHGKVISNGASTHRMAHYDPNLSNCPGVDSPYGADFRRLLTSRVGSILTGVDASGIQLRLLAHLMGDDEYTQQVTTGDIHTFNKEALGSICDKRGKAKTFIYAFLLGSGIGKTALILGCTEAEARAAMKNFYNRIPALKWIKYEWTPKTWRDGYFTAIDGRRVLTYLSPHKCLAGYLQATEKIIMAHAMREWRKELKAAGIDYTLHLTNHDEWQTSFHPRDAWQGGRIQKRAIIQAGEFFELRCPLDGEVKLGRNWFETH